MSIQLQDANDVDTMQAILGKPTISGLLDKPRHLYTIDDKARIFRQVHLHSVLLSRKGEVDQLADGLNVHGLLKLFQEYPDHGYQYLTSKQHQLLASTLVDLFDLDLSPPGSNKRTREERTVIMWYDYLQDIEGTCMQYFKVILPIVFSDGNVHTEVRSCEVVVTLESILLFITGSTSIPPTGFETKPTITFSHDPNVTVPTANTCSLTICLPTAITDAAIFSSRMTYGIFNSVGFGLFISIQLHFHTIHASIVHLVVNLFLLKKKTINCKLRYSYTDANLVSRPSYSIVSGTFRLSNCNSVQNRTDAKPALFRVINAIL